MWRCGRWLRLASVVLGGLSGPALAEEDGWRVARISGEAWVTRAGNPPSKLAPEATIAEGDTVQTSRNGRLQLLRGAETVLVAPNTVVQITEGEGSRTIVRQRAGSVTVEAEKKNIEHFEVRTPMLAAVVKGTQFTVTLQGGKASVAVSRGQVDVTSLKSGQSVLVLPGQRASVGHTGHGGLSVTGTGVRQPVRTGQPRTSDVKPAAVPRGGFTGPSLDKTSEKAPASSGAALHIAATIGPRIDIRQATKGLASEPRGSAASGHGKLAKSGSSDSVWKLQADAQVSGSAQASGQAALIGSGNTSGAASIAAGSASGTSGATSGAAAGDTGGAASASQGVGNAISAAATAAAGSGGAAVSAAVHAAKAAKK